MGRAWTQGPGRGGSLGAVTGTDSHSEEQGSRQPWSSPVAGLACPGRMPTSSARASPVLPRAPGSQVVRAVCASPVSFSFRDFTLEA